MPNKEDAALVLPRSQRPYVSTSETYYKENAINPPQPAKRSIKVNFFPAFIFPIFISLSLLLKKSTYHAPYHQPHFPFFFPTAFLTRFVLPTSFFTSSLASSIAIRSRRSSAILPGTKHTPLHSVYSVYSVVKTILATPSIFEPRNTRNTQNFLNCFVTKQSDLFVTV